MTVNCYICHQPFKEDEEIVGVMVAYWHELPSRVNFSITKPHHAYRDTLHHLECPTED
jgi:hypothetical protein